MCGNRVTMIILFIVLRMMEVVGDTIVAAMNVWSKIRTCVTLKVYLSI
jgi:hypothetical protein